MSSEGFRGIPGVPEGWEFLAIRRGRNDSFVWVAFGTAVEQFDWSRALEKLHFHHADGSTSPFGVEVTDE